MSNKSIYWIGKYESDIINSNFFVGSLTYYGSNLGNNYSFCPQGIRISSMRTNDFICFLTEKIDKIMNDSNNNASFMFYSPKWAYEILRVRPEYEYSFIGVNSQQIVSLLDNKINTRLWFSNICDTPPFKIAAPNECSYELLKNSFPKYEKFIIQEHISSGGKGTYVLTKKNNAQIVAQLNPSSIYIVSPYIVNSYPVNIHLCISSNDVIVFSPSIQIMHNNKNNLLYCGADYISAKRIPNKILLEIKQVSQKIGFLIKDMGYRGVLGIDFIVEKDHVYFVEINPRFQGSSFLLNKALQNRDVYDILKSEKASDLVPVMGTKGAFCFFKNSNLGGRIYEDQTTAFTKIYPSYHRISLVFLDALADLHALSFLCRR